MDDDLAMIQDCENRESKLTDWERTFIDSISMHIGNGNSLTPKQSGLLETIWERVT